MVLNIISSVVFYQLFGLDINVAIEIVNMNTVISNNNQHSTLSTSTLGNVSGGIIYRTTTTTTNSSSGIYNSPTLEQEKLILYIDLMAQLLGIDMNFKRFSEMTPEQIKSFTRDLKLKKIID